MFVSVRIHCSEEHSEVDTNNLEETELTIESIVGPALLELFDTVEFDEVTVVITPYDDDAESE